MNRISLILVPGLAADGRLWQPVLQHLVDLVDPTIAACEGQSIADWGDEILAGAPNRFYVAGTSMGGYVAMEVALRKDPRVAGVILLNTNARGASPEQRERAHAMVDLVRDGQFDQVVEKVSAFVAGGKPELAGPVGTMTRELGPEVFVRQQLAIAERKDRREELARLEIPALVIAGDEDRLAPPSLNNEIARAIPLAELDILPTGHLSTLELPAAVASAMRQWLVAAETAAKRL
jgi:pimeloyl-ACP methyl ester carboxylesterase